MPRPTQLSDLRPGYTLRVTFAVTGAVVFLVAAILVASQAWHAQASGQPIPSGLGKSVAARDGYAVAVGMFLFSLFYAWRSWKITRRIIP
jgi:hypothetical protein